MRATFEILADILEYPAANRRLSIDERDFLLKSEAQPFVSHINLFISSSEGLSLTERQELYARTFDLNPACALEIGYHLFGENYKRGVFLANLRETEEPFDIKQDHQLPDYLPVLLRLLTRLDDRELRTALIAECLIPGLEKMLKAVVDSENPYRDLLMAIAALLETEVTGYPAHRQRAHLPVMQAAAFSGLASKVVSFTPGFSPVPKKGASTETVSTVSDPCQRPFH
jgi:nitrate reductase delta subunit